MVQQSQQDVPEGYVLLVRDSPFIQLVGPFYEKRLDEGFRLGFRAEGKHCNMRGDVHGGVIGTLADMALGYNIVFSQEPPIPAVTANLNVDYLDRVSCGDWVEVNTEIHKIGRRLVFASCIFNVGSRIVAKASAVFSTMGKAIPPEN